MGGIHVFDDVVLRIERGGQARLLIGPPAKTLPRAEAAKAADLPWLRRQARSAIRALREGTPKEVRLACRDSLLRIGGGFMQLEGEDVLLVRRDFNAPGRPGALDICAGVFDDEWRDPLEMMLAETVEVLRIRPSSKEAIVPAIRGPRGGAVRGEYLKALEAVLGRDAADRISLREVNISFIRPDHPVEVFYDDKALLEATITFEVDSSSLELVGIIEFPEVDGVAYSDGEYIERDGALLPLNREVHRVSTRSLSDVVWRRFEIVGTRDFPELLREISPRDPRRALTEKASLALRSGPFGNLRELMALRSAEE